MNPKDAIHDPVFQLNLLVWMAKDQPKEGFRVRPVFSANGFQLHYIEQPFPFPTEMRGEIVKIAETKSLQIKLGPVPELTIQRHTDGQAIYFEAKAQVFSTASSNCEQARGHLLACGPAFAEVHKPLTNALLDYVVPANDSADMRNCLGQLNVELTSATLKTGKYAVDGLSVKGKLLVYHLDEPVRAILPTDEMEIAVMTDLSEDTDPSPLLLVYSDEDCPNEARRGHYRRVLQNQAVATLLCFLHGKPQGQVLEISAQDLLVETTVGVFNFVGRERQKSMERTIVENIFKRMVEHWKLKLPNKVQRSGNTLTLDFKIFSDREAILDWLEDTRKTGFDDQKPKDDGQLYLLAPE